MKKESVLLHICCAPDATAVFEQLRTTYDVVGFFHNPNIYPVQEYAKRLQTARHVAEEMGFTLWEGTTSSAAWYKHIKGLEQEPEKGKRCEACFDYNLDATACFAAQHSIPWFTTTLSISPHKRSDVIFRVGRAAAEKHGVGFLEIDFKKKEGFKRSLQLSREMSLYRQHYCGCEFSIPGEKDA
ncbi:epoxyqueuosine reductase QueH [bacterium]|nr:epoxyqueuosine reductase QueH [bacterium]